MKGVIAGLLLGLVVVGTANAQWVNGYTRKDGTYVNGYYRTDVNNSPYDNQSYPGNYNLNTGRETTGSQEKYLNNYYNKNNDYSNTDYNYGSKPQKSVYDIYGNSQD